MTEQSPNITPTTKVGLSTIAYNQPELLQRLIGTALLETLDAKAQLFVTIFVHSYDKRVADAIVKCKKTLDEHGFKCLVQGNGTNRGVAKSWNDSILTMREYGCGVMLLANDDTWLEHGDMAKIIKEVESHRKHYAVLFSGYHIGLDKPVTDHGFAFFAINPIAIETIGAFDENFFPAYNEDLDYQKRAIRAGLDLYKVGSTNIQHQGSATIKASVALELANQQTHYNNDRYWFEKWGCMKENMFQGNKHPFGDEEMHPFYIPMYQRHNPYGRYDRKDL